MSVDGHFEAVSAATTIPKRVTIVDRVTSAYINSIAGRLSEELPAESGLSAAKRRRPTPAAAHAAEAERANSAKRARNSDHAELGTSSKHVQTRIDDGRRVVSDAALGTAVRKLCDRAAASNGRSSAAVSGSSAGESGSEFLSIIKQLKGMFCTAEMLEESRAGAIVFRLCKSTNPAIAAAASELYASWRKDLHFSAGIGTAATSAATAAPAGAELSSESEGAAASRGRRQASSAFPTLGSSSMRESSISSKSGSEASGAKWVSSSPAYSKAKAATAAAKVHTLGAARGIAGAAGPVIVPAGLAQSKASGRSASAGPAKASAAAGRPSSAAGGGQLRTATASRDDHEADGHFSYDDDGHGDDRDAAPSSSSGAAARDPLPFTRSGGVGLSMMDAVDIDAEVDAWADVDRLAARRRKSPVPPPTKLPAASLSATAPANLGLRHALLGSAAAASARGVSAVPTAALRNAGSSRSSSAAPSAAAAQGSGTAVLLQCCCSAAAVQTQSRPAAPMILAIEVFLRLGQIEGWP